MNKNKTNIYSNKWLYRGTFNCGESFPNICFYISCFNLYLLEVFLEISPTQNQLNIYF